MEVRRIVAGGGGGGGEKEREGKWEGVGEGRKEAVPAWIDEQLIHPRLNHFRHDRVLFRLAAPVRVDRQDIGGLSPVRYKHSIYTVR